MSVEIVFSEDPLVKASSCGRLSVWTVGVEMGAVLLPLSFTSQPEALTRWWTQLTQDCCHRLFVSLFPCVQ